MAAEDAIVSLGRIKRLVRREAHEEARHPKLLEKGEGQDPRIIENYRRSRD